MNIKTALDQYNKRKNRRQGMILATDIADILILSKKKPEEAAIIGLKAGYMIGYKAGKRQKATRRTQKTQ
jgi:hypothetical protein